MSTIYLKVKGLAGSDILQVSKEAIELANKVGVAVEFDFNGVVCVARPNESAESLAKNWEQEASSKKKYKFASSEEANTVEKGYQDLIEKCKNSPYFFATNYLTINGKPFSTMLSEEEFNKQFLSLSNPEPSSKKDMRVKEDMICPVTKKHCDDECCPVGAICNLSSVHTQCGNEIEAPTNTVEDKPLFSMKDIESCYEVAGKLYSPLYCDFYNALKELAKSKTKNQ